MILSNHQLAAELTRHSATIATADDAAALDMIRVYDALMNRRRIRATSHVSRMSDSVLADAAIVTICHYTPADFSDEHRAGIFGFDTPDHLKGQGR